MRMTAEELVAYEEKMRERARESAIRADRVGIRQKHVTVSLSQSLHSSLKLSVGGSKAFLDQPGTPFPFVLRP
jgi:hypothetical protein